MTATDPHLDITLLQKVKCTGDRIEAQCPACHSLGNDRTGNHLVILPSGKFACAALPGDSEHRREIFKLVGIVGERKPDPERDRIWRKNRDEEKRRELAKTSLAENAKAQRNRIIARHPWNAADVWHDSLQTIEGPLVELDPRHFIASLFNQDETVWAGEVYDSGSKHADHWQTVAGWQDASSVGPMISPATWDPCETSRSSANAVSSPYTVLDWDGMDGIKPETPAELHRHLIDSLALTRWIREGLGWRLAAIVWTGGKSLHCWFETPCDAALQSLKDVSSAFGLDSGLIGHPEHPARLPGQIHAQTGRMSRVLWLQSPRF